MALLYAARVLLYDHEGLIAHTCVCVTGECHFWRVEFENKNCGRNYLHRIVVIFLYSKQWKGVGVGGEQCDQKKHCQMSIKVAQNDFTKKMIYFDTFSKIA